MQGRNAHEPDHQKRLASKCTAIESLLKLGYTHLPGHAVKVEHPHLAQCLGMCCPGAG